MIGIGIVIGIGGEKRYASFALAMCWPKIEISIQRDFAAATLIEDGNEFKVMGSGQLAVKKVKGAGFSPFLFPTLSPPPPSLIIT